jgi:hypothetical protein
MSKMFVHLFKHCILIFLALSKETAVELNVKLNALPHLEAKETERLQMKIGKLGWERCQKREKLKQHVIQMGKNRDAEVEAKETRLAVEQIELDKMKAANTDMITNKTDIDKEVARVATNKVCNKQGNHLSLNIIATKIQ